VPATPGSVTGPESDHPRPQQFRQLGRLAGLVPAEEIIVVGDHDAPVVTRQPEHQAGARPDLDILSLDRTLPDLGPGDLDECRGRLLDPGAGQGGGVVEVVCPLAQAVLGPWRSRPSACHDQASPLPRERIARGYFYVGHLPLPSP